jgi:hypothetical protein
MVLLENFEALNIWSSLFMFFIAEGSLSDNRYSMYPTLNFDCHLHHRSLKPLFHLWFTEAGDVVCTNIANLMLQHLLHQILTASEGGFDSFLHATILPQQVRPSVISPLF